MSYPPGIVWGPNAPRGPLHLSHVDAEPYRRVIAAVHRHVPMRVIAEATGISRYRLTQIETGRVWRIRVGTAEKLRSGLPKLLPSESGTSASSSDTAAIGAE